MKGELGLVSKSPISKSGAFPIAEGKVPAAKPRAALLIPMPSTKEQEERGRSGQNTTPESVGRACCIYFPRADNYPSPSVLPRHVF